MSTATALQIPERGRFSISSLWEDDTSGLEVAVYIKASDGTGLVYRSELVAGVDAGQSTDIPVDLAAVFDQADDPATAASVQLPVGTYDMEIVAGHYEASPLPHSTVGLTLQVLDFFSIA